MSVVLTGSRRTYALLLFCQRVPAGATRALRAPALPAVPAVAAVAGAAPPRPVTVRRLHHVIARWLVGFTLLIIDERGRREAA
jgi:hypothetical protein